MTLTEEQGGFDLEKARASIAHYRIENPSNVDTESALKELVDQANLAEDALAEIERLRAYLVEHEEHENQTHEVLENILGTDDTLENVAKRAAARIKDLKKEIRRLKHESKVEVKFTNSYIKRLHDAEARIKELENALVEERTGAIRCESYDHCEGMYRIDLPDAMIRAQQELQAEGKIGPDARPRSWQITDERAKQLDVDEPCPARTPHERSLTL